MLQTKVSQARYVTILICSDGSVNSMFEFTRINEINMLELHLNNWTRQGDSSGMELTRVQVTLIEPHKHQKQLIHLCWVVMLIDKYWCKKLLIWKLNWVLNCLHIVMENPDQVMTKMTITLIELRLRGKMRTVG